MPAKRPTARPSTPARSGCGSIGSVGTSAGTSTSKLPVDGGLEDLEVAQALLQDEVVGRLLGGALVLGELGLDGLDRVGDLGLHLLPPRGDEGGGVRVGRGRRQLGALALGDDRDDVVGVGVGAGLGHLGGDGDGRARRRIVRSTVKPSSASSSAVALADVAALDHGPDRLQLGGAVVDAVVARAAGERVGHVERLLVDEVGLRLVDLGLAGAEEVGGAGRDDHDEEDDPLAAPDDGEVVAEGEALLLGGRDRDVARRQVARRVAPVAGDVAVLHVRRCSYDRCPLRAEEHPAREGRAPWRDACAVVPDSRRGRRDLHAVEAASRRGRCRSRHGTPAHRPRCTAASRRAARRSRAGTSRSATGLTTVAGLPATTMPGGTSWTTTEPAPTSASSPISTPGRIVAVGADAGEAPHHGAALALLVARAVHRVRVVGEDDVGADEDVVLDGDHLEEAAGCGCGPGCRCGCRTRAPRWCRSSSRRRRRCPRGC